MTVKYFHAFCLFLFVSFGYSQTPPIHTFGEPFKEEFAMTRYANDPEAAGVVLYERGNYYFDLVDNHVLLIKEVHVKMKVFDVKNFKHGTVEIPFYSEKNKSENVEKITAITHNGTTKTFINSNAIFTTDENPKWSIKKFTFPNIQNGSILEYKYRIETGYYLNFGGWQFQEDLPKLYSELHTELPGNFQYNRTLYGNLKLYINEAEKKLACFSIQGFDVQAECEIATYAMRNVPAAKKENFMLSEDNYLAGLRYELIEFIDFERSKHPFTRNWDDVDNLFKNDKDLGRQLKFDGFFKESLPESIFAITDKLEKAKAVYYNIQNKMTWDGKYRIFSEVRVKEAFERNSGNSSEINLALINALEAAGIDSKIMLISTRDFASPTMQYPVITDFIYAIVFLEINNQKYFLDATDKNSPFGVLPFRDLCVQGRVMDFKKGSYWEPIVPIEKNMHYINMQLTAANNGIFSGKVSEVSTGYIAVPKRKNHADFTKEEILKRKQNNNEFLDIANLQVENVKDLEQPFKENFDLTIHHQPVGNKLFVYPFLIQPYFSENPFSKETRTYPIDFGFPVINNYLISIDMQEAYEIVNVPENKILKLPNNDGELSVVYDVSGSKVNIRLSAKLNNTSFSTEAYPALRQFFETLIKLQTEEPLELKKL